MRPITNIDRQESSARQVRQLPLVPPDAVLIAEPDSKSWAELAYGGNREPSNATDVEIRLQRLERGQKFVRRGRVIPSLPQFKSQSFISQTSGNNPFVTHSIGGAQFPSGQVPDQITPTANNSQIRYPRSSTQL